MIEVLFIVAIGAIILLWVDRKSKKDIINRQCAQIKQLSGVRNKQDELEAKQRLDDFHYERIIRQIKFEDEYAYMTPDEIVYEKANKRFYEIYGYEYNGRLEINNNITPIITIYTKVFDKHIKDIFPNSNDDAIMEIARKLNLAKLEANILFERWRKFYLIDYNPYEGWIPNYPKETLTIEQFKEKMSITRIDVKKDSNTGLVYFECGRDIKGEVMLNQIPKNPMMSKFVLSNSKVYWLLHENGEL